MIYRLLPGRASEEMEVCVHVCVRAHITHIACDGTSRFSNGSLGNATWPLTQSLRKRLMRVRSHAPFSTAGR